MSGHLPPDLVLARVGAVRGACLSSIEFDAPKTAGTSALTDRAWLAQSVINILDGLIDDQLLNPEDED